MKSSKITHEGITLIVVPFWWDSNHHRYKDLYSLLPSSPLPPILSCPHSSPCLHLFSTQLDRYYSLPPSWSFLWRNSLHAHQFESFSSVFRWYFNLYSALRSPFYIFIIDFNLISCSATAIPDIGQLMLASFVASAATFSMSVSKENAWYIDLFFDLILCFYFDFFQKNEEWWRTSDYS